MSVTANSTATDSTKPSVDSIGVESKPQQFSVLFGSDDEDYSGEGEDISGDPYWKPLLEVANKYGPRTDSL
jgi:hypothetical protein